MNSVFRFRPYKKSSCPAPELTFGTFVVGDSNREAFSAANSVLTSPGSFLVLCGGSSVGKTHLLHAIHNGLLARNPTADIKHMNTDVFTAYLIHSIRTGNPEPFREECETVDVLLVDDVQYLSGKERTQEEFFRFLKTRVQTNRLTVLTLDSAFEDAQSIENSLRSFFPNIVWSAVNEPDHEVRAEILRAKASELELRLSDEEIELIAKNVPGDLRTAFGVLKRISLYDSFPETFPDAPSISEIIRDASQN
ncbi:MAG: ATP-binding protein [Lentisphaeria bacterium]|nr:ATP-binding protein [Lentisphaeria bacterium]